MPDSIADHLDRLRVLNEEDGPRSRVLRPWALAIPLLFASALVVTVLGAFWLAPTSGTAAPSSRPIRPSLAQVSAQAGLTPHQLYGARLQDAVYLTRARSKQPEPGLPGVVLLYAADAGNVDVYEFRDPAPASRLAADPAGQAPAVSENFSGVDCLVWLTPNRAQITQFGFKTSVGLVIYVLPHSPLNPDAVTSLVARLKSAS